MRVLSVHTGQATPRTHLLSFGGHVVIVALALLAPVLGVFPEPKTEFEVQFVRLKGGGETIPGWIKPTPARSDDAAVPDNKPQEQPKPVEEQQIVEEAPPPPVETQPEPEELAPPDPAAEEKPPPSEPVSDTGDEAGTGEDPASAAAEEASSGEETETGAGVGAKPGPEGAGLGAVSDATFAGSNAYLSRVEAEVQRRFNFRGKASGKVAEYHFALDRKGKVQDLVLMESSGVPSLDLAARSALMRAKLPPLPASFPHERLGITYKFYGDGSR
jgi:periplasmic protein TonB